MTNVEKNRRTIPTASGGARHTDELDRYLNQLLDEAFDEAFPPGDAQAAPKRPDLANK